MHPILVVGSLGYDTITTPKGTVTEVLGGSANYFSLAASHYGPVRVVGVVGSDYRDEDLAALRSRGVDTSGLALQEGKTFRWSGKYEGSMNDAITLKTELNVLKSFDPKLPEEYKNSPYVFLGNIDPVLQMRVLEQIDSPKIIGLDTMNYWIDSKQKDLEAVLAKVDVFLVNEGEAKKFTGEENTIKAIKTLSEMGPKAIVVKRGEYGFVLFAENHFFMLPAFPVQEVIDPTGAGDSFAGGFFGYFGCTGEKATLPALKEACVHGAVVASFSVQDFSTRSLVSISRTKIEARRAEYIRATTLSN
jgi:sugar/nucleoside kinase (ribokinase family)